jgi:hypothetical protein
MFEYTGLLVTELGCGHDIVILKMAKVRSILDYFHL